MHTRTHTHVYTHPYTQPPSTGPTGPQPHPDHAPTPPRRRRHDTTTFQFTPEVTAATMAAGEKTKNFNADGSKKTKGARGFRKGEHWGEALEFHDRQYKVTRSNDYIK